VLPDQFVMTFHGLGSPVVPLARGEDHYFVAGQVYRETIRLLPELETRFGVTCQITFDDGNASDFAIGVPGLLEAKRKGLFFILAGRLDKRGYLTRQQLREMTELGMEIGTHGWDHIDWRALDEGGKRREFTDARKALEDVTGLPVPKAAIPFGRFNASVLQDLKRAKYARIYTSTSGLSYPLTWFCPRWSPTRTFKPNRDLAPHFDVKARIKGAIYAGLRPLRYRYGFL